MLGYGFLFMAALSLLLLGGSAAIGGWVVRRWNKKRGAGIRRGWGWAVGIFAGLVVLAIGIQPLVLFSGFLAVLLTRP